MRYALPTALTAAVRLPPSRTSSASPTGWPNESLYDLKPSRSKNASSSGRSGDASRMRCSRSLIRLRRFRMPVSESRSAASFSSRCDERSVTAPNPSSKSAPISIAISEMPRLSYQVPEAAGDTAATIQRLELCGW